MLANVIPSYTSAYLEGVDERIAELGELLNAYVEQLGSPHVKLVDVRSGFTEELMMDDGIHPNDDGSSHIASAFYSVLTENGYCKSL